MTVQRQNGWPQISVKLLLLVLRGPLPRTLTQLGELWPSLHGTIVPAVACWLRRCCCSVVGRGSSSVGGSAGGNRGVRGVAPTLTCYAIVGKQWFSEPQPRHLDLKCTLEQGFASARGELHDQTRKLVMHGSLVVTANAQNGLDARHVVGDAVMHEPTLLGPCRSKELLVTL